MCWRWSFRKSRNFLKKLSGFSKLVIVSKHFYFWLKSNQKCIWFDGWMGVCMGQTLKCVNNKEIIYSSFIFFFSKVAVYSLSNSQKHLSQNVYVLEGFNIWISNIVFHFFVDFVSLISDLSYTLTLDADLKGSRVTSRGLFVVNNERYLKEKIKISPTSLCVDRRVYVQVSVHWNLFENKLPLLVYFCRCRLMLLFF